MVIHSVSNGVEQSKQNRSLKGTECLGIGDRLYKMSNSRGPRRSIEIKQGISNL